MWSRMITSARPSCCSADLPAASITSPMPTYGNDAAFAMTPWWLPRSDLPSSTLRGTISTVAPARFALRRMSSMRPSRCTLSAMRMLLMGTPVRSASMTGRLPSMKSAMFTILRIFSRVDPGMASHGTLLIRTVWQIGMRPGKPPSASSAYRHVKEGARTLPRLGFFLRLQQITTQKRVKLLQLSIQKRDYVLCFPIRKHNQSGGAE